MKAIQIDDYREWNNLLVPLKGCKGFSLVSHMFSSFTLLVIFSALFPLLADVL